MRLRLRPFAITIVLLATAVAGGYSFAHSRGWMASPESPGNDEAYITAHYKKSEHQLRMRDGTHLYTAVYTPRDAGPNKKYPILIERTPFSSAPYGEENYPKTLGPDSFTLRDGYIYVVQNVRGRYLSEGSFENVRPLLPDSVKARNPQATDEATDAEDTIEWLLANLPAQSGRVGIWGASYRGFYAAQALASHHPALVAASIQAPTTDMYFEDYHHNGALTQAYFTSYPIFGAARAAPTTENWWLQEFLRLDGLSEADDYAWQLSLGPISTFGSRFYQDNTWWREIVAHPDYDEFWQARAVPRQLRDVNAAVLVVGGWFDGENLYGPFALYQSLREKSPAAQTSLVVGPFGHRGWLAPDDPHTTVGNIVFGDSLAVHYQHDVQAPFFRTHLKGMGTPSAPGVRAFDTGLKRWQEFASWPAAGGRKTSFHLQGDGSLTAQAPLLDGAFREYLSDPSHPVPTRCSGPTLPDLTQHMIDDQRCFADRKDVLTFVTEPLTEEVTIAGPATVRLIVSTSGTDADFVAKLIDVYPLDTPNDPNQPDPGVKMGGFQQLVRGEIMRGRYRTSFSTPLAFVPGERTEVDVPLLDVLHTFKKGHRIMLQVQSSWFPLFDRNPQTFVPNIYEAAPESFQPATQRIWVGRDASSQLEFSVLPRQ